MHGYWQTVAVLSLGRVLGVRDSVLGFATGSTSSSGTLRLEWTGRGAGEARRLGRSEACERADGAIGMSRGRCRRQAASRQARQPSRRLQASVLGGAR